MSKNHNAVAEAERQQQEMLDVAGLKWGDEETQESLSRLFRYAEIQAKEKISWYRTKKKSKQFTSLFLRCLAIIFAILGGLCPLIGGSAFGAELSKVGYVLLAVSGGFLLFDKLFGTSAAWMRFMTAAQDLEAELDMMRIRWASISAEPESNASEASATKKKLEALSQFVEKIHLIIGQETGAWVREFRSSIAELEKLGKGRAETRKSRVRPESL